MVWNKHTLHEKCKEKHITGISGQTKQQLWESYLSHCTLSELGHLCQEFKWTGYSQLNKDQLLNLVRENIKAAEEKKEHSSSSDTSEKKKKKEGLSGSSSSHKVSPIKTHLAPPKTDDLNKKVSPRKKTQDDEDYEYEELEDDSDYSTDSWVDLTPTNTPPAPKPKSKPLPAHKPKPQKISDDESDTSDVTSGIAKVHVTPAPKKGKKHTPKKHGDDDSDDAGTTTSTSSSSTAKPHKPAKTADGKTKKAKIPDDVRRSCFKIVFGDKLQGKCPVCKFATIGFDKGQFQAAHIMAEAKGGATIAENLVPSCGCNQIMGTTNLFDYMGMKIELRSNLWELASHYWIACTPRAQMEKELKKFGKKYVLVEFLKLKYQPLDLETYKDWLEIPDSWTHS